MRWSILTLTFVVMACGDDVEPQGPAVEFQVFSHPGFWNQPQITFKGQKPEGAGVLVRHGFPHTPQVGEEEISGVAVESDSETTWTSEFSLGVSNRIVRIGFAAQLEDGSIGEWRESSFFYDTTAPEATMDPTRAAVDVSVDTEITIEFNEFVDCAQLHPPNVEAGEFRLMAIGSAVAKSMSLLCLHHWTYTRLHLLPTDPLLPGTEYYLRLDGVVKDLAGNHWDPEYGYSFTTAN